MENTYVGKVEHFENSNQQCTRRELEGCPVTVLSWPTTMNYRNKDYPATVVQWVGRHLLELGNETVYVESSTVTDGGPSLGVNLTCIRSPEVPYTDEERAEGRRRIQAVAVQAMIKQGIW